MAGKDTRCCILLKDILVERRGKKRFAPEQPPPSISKGELLVPIKDGLGQSVAAVELRDLGTLRLALKRALCVLVECKTEDVSWLNATETEILEAVEDVQRRYVEFCKKEKLKWCCGLRAGCHLRLRMFDEATGIAHFADGVLRYVGQVGKKKGRMFGVEITERKFRGLGNTNGRFEGGRYFSCDNNCGMFVNVETLSKEVREAEFTRARARPRSACSIQFPPPPPSSPPPSPPPIATKPVKDFVVGERVAVYDLDRVCYYGVVRCKERDALYGNIIGLEMDTPVNREQFPNTLSLDHLSSRFFVQDRSHSKIVLPVKSVQKTKYCRPVNNPNSSSSLPITRTQLEEINDIRLELEKLSRERENALCELSVIQRELKQGRAEKIRLRASLMQLERELLRFERADKSTDPLLHDWLLV